MALEGNPDPTNLEAGSGEPPRTRAELLAESEKLASLDRLAGTVAHEFNNLLTAILGYSELVADQLDGAPSAVVEDVGELRKAARRARCLTQDLLVIAGRQVLRPRWVDPNRLVQDVAQRLAPALGEDVALTLDLAPDPWPIEVDADQLERALIELASNARDAMSSGGTLTLTTANVISGEVDDAAPSHARAGPHVALSVSDRGGGIPTADLPRIFEPFFTTKRGVTEKHDGTSKGLGLALVRGIVKQHGGHVRVTTAPREGTTITLALPRGETAT